MSFLSTCCSCGYYVQEPDQEYGACHGKPPIVMLLPMQPTKEQQIASGGRAQGFALQTVRPTVKATDTICVHGARGDSSKRPIDLA